MLLIGDPHLFFRNPAAVVRDADKRSASIFDFYGDGIGAGVDRVFHKLFDDGSRAFDNLACGDFINSILTE